MGDVFHETNESIDSAMEPKETKDDSMEELKVQDEDVKESSTEEDLLGAKSLMISDSDEEEGGEGNHSKSELPTEEMEVTPSKDDDAVMGEKLGKTDSRKCDPTTTDDAQKEDDDDDDDDLIPRKQNKKRSTIIDSESENDDHEVSSTVIENPEDSANVHSQSTEKETDSENDSRKERHKHKSRKNKMVKKKSQNETDDNADDAVSENKIKSKLLQLVDSETESDSGESNRGNNVKIKNSENIDSNNHNSSSDTSDNESKSHEDSNRKAPKPMRASAKRALDEMQAIQSEQQRLHREAQVSIPYHKPKRRTLQEFLKRRTISRPAGHNEGSPTGVSMQRKSLKMTSEELQEYAKLMEERAKEATEFFKSESEDEVNEHGNSENDDSDMDTNYTPTKIPPRSTLSPSTATGEAASVQKNLFSGVECSDMENKLNESQEQPLNTNESGVEAPHNAAPIESELDIYMKNIETNENDLFPNKDYDLAEETITKDANNSTVDIVSSQPIVTEVVELPRLNLADMHINTYDNVDVQQNSLLQKSPTITATSKEIPSSIEIPLDAEKLDENYAIFDEYESKAKALKKVIAEKHIKRVPTIKGDPNMLIDLESGDLISKKPTAVDDLLQRLLATHRANKVKKTNTVNILSTENGKVEISKINLNIKTDDADTTKEHKPGEAYFKLKENLKSIIKKKRLEELHKKQEKCGVDDEDANDDYDEFENEDIESSDESQTGTDYDNIVVDDEENAIDLKDTVKKSSKDKEEEEEETTSLKYEAENSDDEDNITLRQEDEDDDEDDDDHDDDHEEEDDVDGNGDNDNNDDVTDSKHDSESSDDDSDGNTKDKDEQEDAIRNDIESTQQRRNRIIKGPENDSEDEEDDIDLLKTQIPVKATTIPNSIFSLNMSGTESKNSFDEYGLFGSSASESIDRSKEASAAVISQIPITQRSMGDHEDGNEELMELCSGTFEGNSNVDNSEKMSSSLDQLESPINELASKQILDSQIQPGGVTTEKSLKDSNAQIEKLESNSIESKTISRIISSDEENNLDEAKKRVKRLRKKLKKGEMRLGFSDDEDDEVKNDVNSDNEFEKDDVDDIGKDEPETYVDYDSEENEVLVSMNKWDRLKRGQGFVEQEAELSESEWGSADEDEKNMDNYDIELGDEDEFDRDQIRSELEKIHARKMLDEDIREIRKLKEMLFEDEETDGVGRQRQFRWRNTETGFSLDEAGNMDADGNAIGNNDSGDEENEHIWRKIRYEREQVLQQNGLQENVSTELLFNVGKSNSAADRQQSPLTIISNINSCAGNTPTTSNTIRKINVLTTTRKSEKFSTVVKKTNSPFLIAKSLQASHIMAATSSMQSPGSSATTSIVMKTKETDVIAKTVSEVKTPTNTVSTMSALLSKQQTPARGSFLIRDKEILAKIAGLTKGGKLTANGSEHETAGTVLVKDVKAKNFVFTTLTEEEHEQHLKRKADDAIGSSADTSDNSTAKKPRKDASNTRRQCLIDQLL